MRIVNILHGGSAWGGALGLLACFAAGCGNISGGAGTDHQPIAPETAASTESAAAQATRPALEAYTFHQIHMGMPVEISLWAASPEQAQAAAKAAFARVARVDQLMNDYVPDSEISRLSEQAGRGPVEVSEEMITVLLAARRMHELTGGAFDPTAAPVVRLWREATRTGQLPQREALRRAQQAIGMEKVKIDPVTRTVELTVEGMRLDFGGIAKGYACDLATEALREHGVTISYVQAGGDMVIGEAPPGTDGWNIDVPGREPLTLANTAASISGDTERYVIIDDVRYSHVVDPRTGMGITTRRMAVVIGPRGIETDPLATAGCVMGAARFLEMIGRLEGFTAYVFAAPEE